jgi:hypothetical protein
MFRITFVLALVGGLVCTTTGAPQPPKGADPASGDKETIKSTPTKVTPAASVKFRKDLNLPFTSLNTLGSRIDSARRSGDPVGLASAASELHTAEKVSGKTTSLTSKQLLGESAELASLRRQEAELKAVLHVSQQLAAEEEKVAHLKKMIELAKEEKQKIQKYEEPKDGPRKVIVNNHTTQYIDVQVNGYLRGQVLPGTTKAIVIEQNWNPIVLKGWGDADETTFGPVVLQGRFNTYTWDINGDDAVPNVLP